jgi:ABC-type spermidine/putrescine transport system permease subunit I
MARVATALLLAPALVVLGVAFLLPLVRLLVLSLSSSAGALAPYAALFGDDIYRKVFWNTSLFAVAVTAITLVIGWPTAFVLTRLRGGARTLLFAAVLAPLWISVLVRTFSWMLLLETNGPINRALVGSGVIGTPLALLFNNTGVIIGMVHVLLPYAVLPIYASLVRIDPALLRASEGLGASWLTTLGHVLLPLSAQGIATAATFVFLLSFGFFITPALLGGPSNITLSMLIDHFVSERLDWALAGAASLVLLGLTLLFVGAAGRFVRIARLVEVR